MNLAMVRKPNIPHVSPVWFNASGTDIKNGVIYFNTARGRVKASLKEGSDVAFSILDPDNPYMYVGGNAKVTKVISGPEADDHIDTLAKKYQGVEKYPWRKPGEARIKLQLKVSKLHSR